MYAVAGSRFGFEDRGGEASGQRRADFSPSAFLFALTFGVSETNLMLDSLPAFGVNSRPLKSESVGLCNRIDQYGEGNEAAGDLHPAAFLCLAMGAGRTRGLTKPHVTLAER